MISPNFRGPLFFDLEKQLQVSKLGSANKNNSGPSNKVVGVVAWKRSACGDMELCNDIATMVKQGGGKKRELNGEAKLMGPARKGQKLSLVAKSISGSGMA